MLSFTPAAMGDAIIITGILPQHYHISVFFMRGKARQIALDHMAQSGIVLMV